MIQDTTGRIQVKYRREISKIHARGGRRLLTRSRSPTPYGLCYLCKRWPHFGDHETTGALKFSLLALPCIHR